MPVSILKKVKNTCDKPSLFPTTSSTKQPPCEPGIVDAEKKKLGGCTTNSTNDSNNNFFLSNTQTQTQTAMIAVRKKIKRRPQSLYNVFFMGERKKILHEATLYIRKEMEGADYKSLTVQEKEERMQKLEVTPERLVQLIEKRWVCADKSLLNSYYKLVDVEKKRVEHLTVVKKVGSFFFKMMCDKLIHIYICGFFATQCNFYVPLLVFCVHFPGRHQQWSS